MRDTVVATPVGARERRTPQSPRLTVRGFTGVGGPADGLPMSVTIWNRRQHKQHQYTPRVPVDLPSTAPDEDRRVVSHSELKWAKHTHDLRTRTATDKITSLPEPDARPVLAGDGRVASGGANADGCGGGTRLVSQKQLQREKLAHVAALHGKRYHLR
jgi:hypothetical protein